MRLVMAFVALLFLSAPAAADTIVLRNGRRILALSAYEDGDKVRYQTSAGELSLPKSIVDHIEKGGAVPMAGAPGAAAANLVIAPPVLQPGQVSGGEEVERAAVHDGAVDRGYMRSWKRMHGRGPTEPISPRRWGIMPRRCSSCRAAIWSTR